MFVVVPRSTIVGNSTTVANRANIIIDANRTNIILRRWGSMAMVVVARSTIFGTPRKAIIFGTRGVITTDTTSACRSRWISVTTGSKSCSRYRILYFCCCHRRSSSTLRRCSFYFRCFRHLRSFPRGGTIRGVVIIIQTTIGI